MATPLVETTLLSEFRDRHAGERTLTDEDKCAITEVAEELFRSYYVHLDMKRTRYGVDPVGGLRDLAAVVERTSPTDRAFHDRMLEIIASLHDRHTLYWVPEPYRDRVAALPFRVQRAGRGATAVYLATDVVSEWLEGVEWTGEVPFAKGVEIAKWHGEPIEVAVERNGRWQGGTHADAQLARGVAHLADRPLTFTPLPDDDTVRVGYRLGGQAGEITLPWRVYATTPSPESGNRDAVQVKTAYSIAIDRPVEAIRRAQKERFRPVEMQRERGEAADAALPTGKAPSATPDNLEYWVITQGDKRYGHLRIRSFDIDLVTDFISEIQRLLAKHTPTDGLILDVRGNGGGMMSAGERLLQLFTPRRIQPGGIQFAVTPATAAVAEQPFFRPWRASIQRGLEFGDDLSEPLPLGSGYVEECNGVGQRYFGPVVLIVDALCYSTTDAFAAGFQDHGIGTLIGVDPATGGGGGNPWSVKAIGAMAGKPFELPRDVSFDISVRRNLRVGPSNGVPIEELGVGVTRPDHIVDLTPRDVLDDNHDLVAKALAILADQPSYALDATLRYRDGVARVTLTARGIDELDVYLDGRPVQSRIAATDPIEVPADPRASHLLELYGFADGALVAAWREPFGIGKALAKTLWMTPVSPVLAPTSAPRKESSIAMSRVPGFTKEAVANDQVDAADLPWPDYQNQSEDAIIAVIHQLRAQVEQALDTLAEVRAFELAHTNRNTVLTTADEDNTKIASWTSKWEDTWTSKWHEKWGGVTGG